MNFSWFRDLAHLAQTGNFSQAAELSNVSQPALSRRIKAIEAWVGAALVDRSRQPVVLTSAGVQMLEAGEQALSRLETERQQIQEAQSLPDRYVVTFGTQHSIGWRFYPAWLRAFEDSFGPIISRLRADDLPNCLLDLQAGEVDFVVAYESRSARIARDLPDVESLIIGPRHPAARVKGRAQRASPVRFEVAQVRRRSLSALRRRRPDQPAHRSGHRQAWPEIEIAGRIRELDGRRASHQGKRGRRGSPGCQQA